MNSLIGAAPSIQRKRSAPGIAIVVLLRSAPPLTHCCQRNIAKLTLLHRTADSLDAAVETVLMHREDVHSALLRSAPQRFAVRYPHDNGLLDYHALPIPPNG